MRTSKLLRRNLTHYWRTNLAVVFGVATAVAVLAGALLVGDSVRASLRDLFVQRLGQTDQVITSSGFFRDRLATDMQTDPQFVAGGFDAACPLIALEGTITHEPSKRVGSGIKVYGVDERFWRFNKQERKQAPQNREVYVSESLARELGTNVGDTLVLRVQKPSEIPAESLHSKKEDLGSTLRLTVRETLAPDALGEFSVQPQQSAVRAVFVPLDSLQKEIGQKDKVNLILLSETSRNPTAQVATRELADRILKDRTSLEDFGIKLRIVGERLSETSNASRTHPLPQVILTGAQQSLSLEHDSKMISDSLANTAFETAVGLSLRPSPVFSYLANNINSGGRSIPYSLVTAIDEAEFEELRLGDARARGRGETGTRDRVEGKTRRPAERQDIPVSPRPRVTASEAPPIILNEWAARDLGIHKGDPVSLEYYLWHEAGHLESKTVQFQLAGVVSIKGVAADRDLVPEYPGITASENLADWDPPFPVDLERIRKQDEDYWDQYRTTPKAFIPLPTGQKLWQSRFGGLTSIRFVAAGDLPIEESLARYQQKLKTALDPGAMGFSVSPARAQGLEASRGATDFGEYFLYFSFFLVISALLLTALFFKLGVEQRLREIGVLQALGFPAAKIRTLFLGEGFILAIIGSVIGLAGALAYGQLMMLGLRTWWVDAVGTTMLSLHVSPLSMLLGAAGGIFAALICVFVTLRGLGKESTRSLLTGTLSREGDTRGRGATQWRLFSSSRSAVLLSVAGVLLLIASATNLVGQTPGFFGGGMLLLIAALCFQSAWLRRGGGKSIHGAGWWAVARLGFRNATNRPGRSVLCIALIASATFIIVAVDAFRRGDQTNREDDFSLSKINRHNSGSGGFPLLAESLLPLVHDPNSSEGREALNLAGDGSSAALASVSFARFRLRPGDDTSCLNLYQPLHPRILAATEGFIQSNRFAFHDSLAADADETRNPWLLLNRELGSGIVPVIADANSMTYVLHLKLGDEFVLNLGDGPVRLRIVGALADSIFQSELVMAEKNFLRLFPQQEGYRFFLIDAPERDLSAIAAALEDRLSDFGFDVMPTAERLATFHRVENTYLSTFQMLGGLGLILGTLGMAAVLLRNVLERRRELALLRAVGYNSSHFALMVIAENALLLFCGLVTGTACALLAIAPVFFSRHAQLPGISLGLLLLAVLISGLTASIVATWAALRSPLLPALRAE